MLSRLAARAPLAARLALRDLERYRSRSGAALAAVSFAVFLAVIITIFASIRFDDALDYAAPNLTSNQLIVYAPGNDPNQDQSGQYTPAAKLAAAAAAGRRDRRAAARGRSARARAGDLAEGRRAGQPHPEPARARSPPPSPARASPAQLYVATPALLKAYGISPSEVNPDADILTMRPGLAGVSSRVGLVSGAYFGLPPNAPICPAGDCIDNPVIQTISALPSGEHAPNTLITESAVSALGMQAVPVGWIIQSPTALTAAQINAARQGALAVGATIETKSGQLSLGEISRVRDDRRHRRRARRARDDGRADPRRDHRRPAHAHRGGRQRPDQALPDRRHRGRAGAARRRPRHGGRLPGGARFAHSSIGGTFGNLPWIDMALLVIGMPLVAAAAGWLLGGRAPSAVARQALE